MRKRRDTENKRGYLGELARCVESALASGVIRINLVAASKHRTARTMVQAAFVPALSTPLRHGAARARTARTAAAPRMSAPVRRAAAKLAALPAALSYTVRPRARSGARVRVCSFVR